MFKLNICLPLISWKNQHFLVQIPLLYTLPMLIQRTLLYYIASRCSDCISFRKEKDSRSFPLKGYGLQLWKSGWLCVQHLILTCINTPDRWCNAVELPSYVVAEEPLLTNTRFIPVTSRTQSVVFHIKLVLITVFTKGSHRFSSIVVLYGHSFESISWKMLQFLSTPQINMSLRALSALSVASSWHMDK